MNVTSARVAGGIPTRCVVNFSSWPPPSGYELADFMTSHSLSLAADGGTVTNIKWLQTGLGVEFQTPEQCLAFVGRFKSA